MGMIKNCGFTNTDFISKKISYFLMPDNVARKLVKKTNLSDLRFVPENNLDLFYLYSPEKGVFNEMSRTRLKTELKFFFEFLMNDNDEIRKFLSLSDHWISHIISFLEIQKKVFLSKRKVASYRSKYVAFQNGVLDVQSFKLLAFTPDIFLTERFEVQFPF